MKYLKTYEKSNFDNYLDEYLRTISKENDFLCSYIANNFYFTIYTELIYSESDVDSSINIGELGELKRIEDKFQKFVDKYIPKDASCSIGIDPDTPSIDMTINCSKEDFITKNAQHLEAYKMGLL